MNTFLNKYDITHTDSLVDDIKVFLSSLKPSAIIIITDVNCKEFCYKKIKNAFSSSIPVFTFKSGENNKTPKTVYDIWRFMAENEVDRSSLVVNIGGGLVTDTGGFAASVFKRGVPFINIPTTLLAQIDASAGGKTGVNFGGYKNQIGTFTLPEKVFISDIFFDTLPEDEFLSGFGEMIKHAIIYDKSDYDEVISFIKNDFPEKDFKKLNSLIKKSVKIKEYFVKNDFKDKGLRNTLNFGHTFGHAFESYFLQKSTPVKHGISVAYGIICELFISVKYRKFDKNLFIKITKEIVSVFGKISIPEKDFKKILEYMKQDKKNKNRMIYCTLLDTIGTAVNKNIIREEDVFESLYKLNTLTK